MTREKKSKKRPLQLALLAVSFSYFGTALLFFLKVCIGFYHCFKVVAVVYFHYAQLKLIHKVTHKFMNFVDMNVNFVWYSSNTTCIVSLS